MATFAVEIRPFTPHTVRVLEQAAHTRCRVVAYSQIALGYAYAARVSKGSSTPVASANGVTINLDYVQYSLERLSYSHCYLGAF